MILTKRVAFPSSYQSGGLAVVIGEVGLVNQVAVSVEPGLPGGSFLASDVIRVIRPIVGSTNVVNLEVYEHSLASGALAAWSQVTSGVSLSGAFANNNSKSS